MVFPVSWVWKWDRGRAGHTCIAIVCQGGKGDDRVALDGITTWILFRPEV